MTDRDRPFTAKIRLHPINEIAEQGFVIRFVSTRPGFLGYDPTVRVLDGQMRQSANPLDLPFQEQGGFLLVCRGIARELDARRSRVNDDDEASHNIHSPTTIVLRLA